MLFINVLCLKVNNIYNNFFEEVVVTHIDIELAADFENDKLKVFADLSITKIDESCDCIVW